VNFGPEIKEPIKVSRSLLQKEIYWPAEIGYGGNDRFPIFTAIKARRSSNQPKQLEPFKHALLSAVERFWVIDPYLFRPEKDKGSRQDRIEQILEWFPENINISDIRFLTNSCNKDEDDDLLNQFREHINSINLVPRRTQRINVEIRFHLKRTFDYVHDRFAIIDDELWHFGATVGGLHSQVSAVSRGWRASDHGVEEFFDLAWSTVS